MKKLIPVALVFLMFILGCSVFKNIASRNFTDFDPYKGGLSELLKPEISGSLVTFKLTGSRDTVAQFAGALEAKGFTYNQEAKGVAAIVPVDGALVNYPSATIAQTELTKLAASLNAPLSKKNKGQRFAAKDGAFVGWTNGSLMCIVKSSFAKPAGNFEEAAPF
jgi:hypothetical protein